MDLKPQIYVFDDVRTSYNIVVIVRV